MNFSLKEGGMFLIILVMVESLLFIGTKARAGEKKTRSRSKTDRQRNTALEGTHETAIILQR